MLDLQGCLTKLNEWFEENFLTTGIVVIVICIVEVSRFISENHLIDKCLIPLVARPTSSSSMWIEGKMPVNECTGTFSWIFLSQKLLLNAKHCAHAIHFSKEAISRPRSHSHRPKCDWQKHICADASTETNLKKEFICRFCVVCLQVLGMCFAMTLFCHISRSGLGYKL